MTTKYKTHDNEILDLYRQGYDYLSICEMVDLNRDTLRQICKRIGIDTSKKVIATENDIISKYEELKDVHKVAEFFGYKGISQINKVLIKNGLRVEHLLKHKLETITNLREQGKNYQEIADELGMTRNAVEGFCHRYGLGYSAEERETASHRPKNGIAWNKGKTLTDWNAKVKNKFGDSFRLVSVGETNSRCERTVIVECLKCKTQKEVSSNSFKGDKGKRGHCEVCSANELKANKAIAKQNEKIKKNTRQLKNRLKTKQIGFRFCKCGAILAYQDRLCGDCKNERANSSTYEQMKDIYRKAEIKREARLKNVKRDKDATLVALFEKYKGICYLCGEACDWKDGKWENGVFKVGGKYPSREHVLPLSKGGDDTWSNLRLAHVSCNSKKGAKLLAT